MQTLNHLLKQTYITETNKQKKPKLLAIVLYAKKALIKLTSNNKNKTYIIPTHMKILKKSHQKLLNEFRYINTNIQTYKKYDKK
jgi:hypothetical protein